MADTAISEKGQVTIPKAVRNQLGLRPGMRLSFSSKNGLLIGQKVDPREDAVLKVTGVGSRKLSVDLHLEATRGPVQ